VVALSGVITLAACGASNGPAPANGKIGDQLVPVDAGTTPPLSTVGTSASAPTTATSIDRRVTSTVGSVTVPAPTSSAVATSTALAVQAAGYDSPSGGTTVNDGQTSSIPPPSAASAEPTTSAPPVSIHAPGPYSTAPCVQQTDPAVGCLPP